MFAAPSRETLAAAVALLRRDALTDAEVHDIEGAVHDIADALAAVSDHLARHLARHLSATEPTPGTDHRRRGVEDLYAVRDALTRASTRARQAQRHSTAPAGPDASAAGPGSERP